MCRQNNSILKCHILGPTVGGICMIMRYDGNKGKTHFSKNVCATYPGQESPQTCFNDGCNKSSHIGPQAKISEDELSV